MEEKVNLILKKEKSIKKLQKEIDHLKEQLYMENETCKLTRYFIYIIQDTSVKDPIVYQIGEETIELKYKPIYVGRGCGDRDKSHLVESHNPGVKKMVDKGCVKIEKVLFDLSFFQSVYFEQELIYSIGRKDIKKGPLLNRCGGMHSNGGIDPVKPGPMNLELNKLKLVLERLNRIGNKRLVAESLGISERSVYRLIKGYNIQTMKVNNQVIYYQI